MKICKNKAQTRENFRKYGNISLSYVTNSEWVDPYTDIHSVCWHNFVYTEFLVKLYIYIYFYGLTYNYKNKPEYDIFGHIWISKIVPAELMKNGDMRKFQNFDVV